MTDFAHAGTVSHGTMRPQDLVPTFLGVLRQLAPERAADFERDWQLALHELEEHGDGESPEDEGEMLNELFTLLDNAAPEGYRFGAHEGDGSDYGFWPSRDALAESIAERHNDAIMEFMRKVATTLEDSNASHGYDYRATEPTTMHDDEYRWLIGVFRSDEAYKRYESEREGMANDDIDITLKLDEAATYGDDEAFDGFGLNWSLDIVEVGGAILGGLAPFNYSDNVWVDMRDEEAVSARLQLILDSDLSSIPELCEER